MGERKRVRIAFYKGHGDWRNKVIRWWTKSEYSHAELVLPDGLTWLSISPILSSCVASRKKPEHDPSRWDFLEFEISDEQLQIILNFFEDTEGDRYDWLGMILSQFLPYAIKRRERWYCSEWIAYALRIAGVFHWREIKIYDRCDLSHGVLHRIAEDSLTKQRKECIMKTYNSIPEALADGYTIQQLKEALRIKTAGTSPTMKGEANTVVAPRKSLEVRPPHPGVGSGEASYGSPFYDPSCTQQTQQAPPAPGSLAQRQRKAQSVDPFEPLLAKPITGAYDEELHGWMYDEDHKKKV